MLVKPIFQMEEILPPVDVLSSRWRAARRTGPMVSMRLTFDQSRSVFSYLRIVNMTYRSTWQHVRRPRTGGFLAEHFLRRCDRGVFGFVLIGREVV